MNVLKNLIKKAAMDEVKSLDLKELLVLDYYLPNANVDVHVCIEETESGKYLITESDIEGPNKELYIPEKLSSFLIIESVHDWSVDFNELHYHIVSTKALSLEQLLECIKFFFNINMYYK